MVCDRIVKLVLGDVGLEFEENGGKRKMEKARGSRGGQVTDMREWVLGFGCEVDVGR